MIAISRETEDNYNAIKVEAILLIIKLASYKKFFHTDEGIKALSESSSLIFFLLHQMFVDDLIITISRLTDPPEQGKDKNKKSNSTLERLTDALKKSLPSNDNRIIILDSQLNNLETSTKHIRILRNTEKAHRDLTSAINGYITNTQNGTTSIAAELPKGLTIQDLDNALEAIKDIICTFHDYCFDSALIIDQMVIVGTHETDKTIKCLEYGIKCLDNPQEMIEHLSSIYGINSK